MSRVRHFSHLIQTYTAYRKHVETCAYPPTRIWVEASSRCNLQCSFCGNRQLPESQRGFMDPELFRQLADESAGTVRQFNLFHRGESLLHPGIGEMVRYARDRGIRTRIHTNGTVLTPDLARELIESGLSVLSFSFDGYDKQMYESNRVNADFDQVLGNIVDFLTLKKKMGAREPFAALELMEITDDPPEVVAGKRREFLRWFEGLPLDKFILRRLHNWGGSLGSDTIKPASELKRIPCPLLWHALVVLWDGQVLPCPQDFFGVLRLGDARQDRLDAIWNGEEIRALRREMADPASLERHPCVDCDRILRATIAGVPVDYLGRFISENVLGNGWLGRILPH